jgi:hypothetical protein
LSCHVFCRVKRSSSSLWRAGDRTRVARWFCFQTKNPNLGKFWRAFWMINVGIFYDHLEYVITIWYA